MSVRVLHITRDAPPRDNGGISTAVRLLNEATTKYVDCQHFYVSFDGWRPKQNTGNDELDETTNFGVRLSHAGQIDAAHGWCRTKEFDVLHVHDPLLWDFAVDVRDALDAPVVYTAHIVQHAANGVRNIERSTRSSVAEACALRDADLVHVASHCARDLLALQGVDRSQLAMVRWPLAVRAAPIIASENTKPRFMCSRETTADIERHEAALILSRFGYLKGTDRAFDLLNAWFREDHSARCDWIGGLPDSPKRERRWIKKWRALAQHHQARLRFRGWKIRTEAIDQLSPGRVVICPSRHESFGLGVAEAMAAGCAVVSSPCGGPTELIEDGVSGVLFNAGITSEDNIERLRSLLDSPADRVRIGDAARSRIRELCDPRTIAEQFAELYRTAAAAG